MTTTVLDTLYKKTSTGAIQFWKISVEEANNLPSINTLFGQLDGKVQSTSDVIKTGKNIGKKHETTAWEQARLEAQAKWEKQLKKGYVKTIEEAQAGTVDSIIEGGVNPMLAHKFRDHAAKISYPAFIQPKLDGIRCIAILKDGVCNLWSRTRKPITGVPHIQRFLESRFGKTDLVLDGELYNHDFKNNFEEIVSFVRQQTPKAGHEVVEYHLYDIVHSSMPFEARSRTLNRHFMPVDGPIRLVQTELVSYDEAVEWFATFQSLGYEGAMLRNELSPYKNGRSYDLQKMKEFETEEFTIVDIEEGRGKLTGHVGAFVCQTKGGDVFRAKMEGSLGRLKELFENHGLWQGGKKLTVRYQMLTGYGVPRFPVGVEIRDYE